jgi:hypothetical protein
MSPQQDWVFGEVEDGDRARPEQLKARRSPSHAPQHGTRRVRRVAGRLLLFVLWVATFTAGATCAAMLAAGLLREGTFTDARVPLDLSRRGEWHRYHFHPSVPGNYVLYLASEDPEDRTEEHVFAGRVYVRVENQRGRAELSERYEPPALDHRLRGGVEWTRLGALHIDAPSVDPWTLAVRAGPGDEAFATIRSQVLVVRTKGNTGIDGLANYVAALPALLLLALSVPAAVGLPRRGGTWLPALFSFVALGVVVGMVYAT